MNNVAGNGVYAVRGLKGESQSHQTLGSSKGHTSAERLMSATEGELHKSFYPNKFRQSIRQIANSNSSWDRSNNQASKIMVGTSDIVLDRLKELFLPETWKELYNKYNEGLALDLNQMLKSEGATQIEGDQPKRDEFDANNIDHYIYALSISDQLTDKLDLLIKQYDIPRVGPFILQELKEKKVELPQSTNLDFRSSLNTFYQASHTTLAEYILQKLQSMDVNLSSQLLSGSIQSSAPRQTQSEDGLQKDERDKKLEDTKAFINIFKKAILCQNDQLCVDLLKIYKPNAELIHEFLREECAPQITYFASLIGHKKVNTLAEIKTTLGKERFNELLDQSYKDQSLLLAVIESRGPSIETLNILCSDKDFGRENIVFASMY